MALEKYNKLRTRHQRRVQHLKYTYGLSEQDYLNLLEKQEYTCMLCDLELIAWHKNTHVDHCHDGGHVRGLLCRECNTTLGWYQKIKRLGLDRAYDNYLLGD